MKIPSEAVSLLDKQIRVGDSNDIKILKILKFVNQYITYQTDVNIWKATEKWQTAEETWNIKTGDCEDGAILIYVLANHYGISDEQIRIVAGDVWDGKNANTITKYISKQSNIQSGDGLCQKEYKVFKKEIESGIMQYQEVAKLNKDNDSLLLQSLKKALCLKTKDMLVEIAGVLLSGSLSKIDSQFATDVETIGRINSVFTTETKIDWIILQLIWKYYVVLVMEKNTTKKIVHSNKNSSQKETYHTTQGSAGHCYCVYTSEEDALEYPIDWCYWYDKSKKMNLAYIANEDYFFSMKEWFSFNRSGIYKQK
jgi:hypothetical protein